MIAKYSIVIFQFLLHSRTKEQWMEEDELTFKLFRKIFHFSCDKREKVRLQALRSFVLLC